MSEKPVTLNESRWAAWFQRTSSVFDKPSSWSRAVNTFGMVIFVVMVCVTFVDVVLRYFFRRPIAGSVEVTQLMLVVMVFAGIAYTQLRRGHILVDVITEKLVPKVRIGLEVINGFLGIGIFVLVISQVIPSFIYYIQSDKNTTTLSIPEAPFLAFLAFGCILFTFVLLRDLFKNLAELVRLGYRASHWLLLTGIVILLVVGAALVVQLQISRPLIGTLASVVMILLMMLGMPVAIALLMTGLLFYIELRGLAPVLHIAGVGLYNETANYNYAAIPFFVLMGFIVFRTGMGKDAFEAAHKWIGHTAGGLASATIAAGTVMSAVVGDILAVTITMGAVALPEMRRYKYDDVLSAGVIATVGTLGPIIPPSIIFIIYGVLVQESIARLFIAGIVPGVMLAVSFIILTYIRCKRNPNLGPPGEKYDWGTRFKSLKSAGPIGILFALVIGGIYLGAFTPTEGGAIGAAGALIIGLAMRRFNRKNFVEALLESGKTTAMVVFLLAAAHIFSQLIAASTLPDMLANYLAASKWSSFVVMLAIVILYVFLGCFISGLAIMVITIPILYPIAIAYGFDSIWFGVITALLISLGCITPPFGISCFGLRGVSDLPLSTIFRGVMPYVYVYLLVVIILWAFPPVVTWLPYLIK